MEVEARGAMNPHKQSAATPVYIYIDARRGSICGTPRGHEPAGERCPVEEWALAS